MMMNSVDLEFTRESECTRVAVAGEFTEHADFSGVLALKTPRIVFDLRGVRRINSCGVREWIRLIDALQTTSRGLVLERCSVPFVTQMNMIVNFIGGARVRSFYAPYLCVHCGAECVELCEVPAEGACALSDSVPCPTCGLATEFDDIRESYLAFTQI